MKPAVITIDVAACTDVGLVRKNNEDYFLVADLNSGQAMGDLYRSELPSADIYMLLAVSDGMGGQLAGEVASKLTIETLHAELMKMSRKMPAYDRLVQAVEQANYQVYRMGMRPEYRNM